MTILAIMQNQWFKNPQRAEQSLARVVKNDPINGRNRWIARMLFYRCLTGRRLRGCFGESLCEQIIWEESSPHIGGKAAATFPPDPRHIAEAIRKHKPGIVLTFGRNAGLGLSDAFSRLGNHIDFRIIAGPHPAARHATVIAELKAMAAQLKGDGL